MPVSTYNPYIIKSEARSLLREHGQRVTGPRIKLLTLMKTEFRAYTIESLQFQLGDGVDKVTLYRTLNTFVNNRMVHRMIDNSGTVHFVLHPQCYGVSHRNPYLFCQSCTQLFSMPEIPIDYSQKLRSSGVDFILMQGICQKCSSL